ncbi:hypothetical protein BDV06DRAFT_214276 [Aspergillus oleicola]
MKFPKTYNTYFVAFITTVGGMLFGFDISSMSAIIGTDQYNDYFDNPAGLRQGAIGSSLAAGSVVGSAMAGFVSDKIGRRDSIAFAFLNGVCVGLTSSQVPVYLAEIAKKEKCGQLIFIQHFIAGTASFRTAWGIQFVPCAFLMAGLPFLPRSPRWLAKVGFTEEAIATLVNIQAGDNRDDPLVVAEWEEITQVLQAGRSALPGWRKFVYSGMWKRPLAGFTVQMWQQNSGANYVVYIFMMANLTGNINLISSRIQYALFIIFTTFTFFYIDKTGRRPLLVYGALIMGCCHFVVGGILSSGEYVLGGVDGNENVLIRVTGPKSHTVIAFSYLLFYALTLAPVCWVYAAEMFIIFGAMCILAAIHFFFTYPETCGKTLEEIEDMFAPGGPKPWHTKPGGSELDAHIDEVRAHSKHINSDTMEIKPRAEVKEGLA